ncbi:MAG: alkaline phosphatase family protein, partial [Archangium sp.]|nr:alkaline phosphatase family protein [Archangium sp.]
MIRLLAAAIVLSMGTAWAKPPRLALFVSLDSFGSDVFQRNRARFKAGLGRVSSDGAVVPVVRYEVAECVTAEGHTTLATGAYPWRHGIVGNRIINRSTGKLEPVFVDPGHPVLDAPLGLDDASPANLLAETVSDRLRASTGSVGKAISIAGKARAAIAMGGKLGEAWWFHEPQGRFVTGTWYLKEAPAWVKGFNDKKLPDGYHAKRWELSGSPKDMLGEDDRPLESDWYGMGRTFPHGLTGGLPGPGPQSYSALASSPFMNDVLVEFAKAAIEANQLGKDDVPDLLSISLSPLDRTYHLYGPTSWEMQDHLTKLDKSLGDLFTAAERAAGGKQNLVIMISGDHGGAALPEEWAALGLDGVRVAPTTIEKALNDELAKLGVANAVLAIEETDVYLDLKAIADKKLDGAVVRRAAAAFLAKLPDVAFAVARDDLATAEAAGFGAALRHGWYPERSGDVVMVLKPFHVLESEPRGTSHGTPYSYDSEVP